MRTVRGRREGLQALAVQVSEEAAADVAITCQTRAGQWFHWPKGDDGKGSAVATEAPTRETAVVNARTRDDSYEPPLWDLMMLSDRRPDAEGILESYLKQRGIAVIRARETAPV